MTSLPAPVRGGSSTTRSAVTPWRTSERSSRSTRPRATRLVELLGVGVPFSTAGRSPSTPSTEPSGADRVAESQRRRGPTPAYRSRTRLPRLGPEQRRPRGPGRSGPRPDGPARSRGRRRRTPPPIPSRAAHPTWPTAATRPSPGAAPARAPARSVRGVDDVDPGSQSGHSVSSTPLSMTRASAMRQSSSGHDRRATGARAARRARLVDGELDPGAPAQPRPSSPGTGSTSTSTSSPAIRGELLAHDGGLEPRWCSRSSVLEVAAAAQARARHTGTARLDPARRGLEHLDGVGAQEGVAAGPR